MPDKPETCLACGHDHRPSGFKCNVRVQSGHCTCSLTDRDLAAARAEITNLSRKNELLCRTVADLMESNRELRDECKANNEEITEADGRLSRSFDLSRMAAKREDEKDAEIERLTVLLAKRDETIERLYQEGSDA